MRVLLVKPAPRAVDFGLAPFFQTEPLGIEYVAAVLARDGHVAAVADLRFERRSLARLLASHGPEVVGISCVHILDATPTRALAAAVKAIDRGITVVVGGHAASMYPAALAGCADIDAIACGEGEWTMPELCRALAARRGLDSVEGLLLPDGAAGFTATAETPADRPLDGTLLPDRATVARYQSHYCCLNYMPVWTVETARGCRYRCKFCSVWEFNRRSLRFRETASVRADFETTGPSVFVVDDAFWTGPERSLEVADALLASEAAQKHWLLVQSRVDTAVEQPELLERWRPLAKNFDIFFGFEAPTSQGLRALHKDVDVQKTVDAIGIARRLGFGVTGNFIIDPAYGEEDFRELWDFLARHQLSRVGFTILTPLPGTRYFEQMRDRVTVEDWDHYDLHHLLWQPKLPVQRFFELYCETWRRTVLNLQGQKKWWHWLAQVRVRDIPRLMRILARTQRLMNPDEYIARTALSVWHPGASTHPEPAAVCADCAAAAQNADGQ